MSASAKHFESGNCSLLMTPHIGSILPPIPLPPKDHVLRSAGSNRLQKNEAGEPIALLPQAFELRPGEQYLSVTWVEYFQAPSTSEGTYAAIRAIREQRHPGKNGAYAIALVGEIAA